MVDHGGPYPGTASNLTAAHVVSSLYWEVHPKHRKWVTKKSKTLRLDGYTLVVK